jgi:hypothetical protein
MKYTAEMGLGAVIYIKTGSAMRKLIKGDTQTYRQHENLISLL